jgi:hypothetical protein
MDSLILTVQAALAAVGRAYPEGDGLQTVVSMSGGYGAWKNGGFPG